MTAPCIGDTASQLRNRRAFLFAGTAMLATHGIESVWAHALKPAPISGFELPQPMALQPFRLVDHRGQTFDHRSLEKRWTLLLFGFTHCPDVCPTTLLQIAEIRGQVASRRENIPTASVFVTIDPARDTRQRLAGYVAQFGDDLVGVTGPSDDLQALAKQFRIRYTPTRPTGHAGYLFDHTASVSVLGPDARLYAIFTLPLRPDRVSADLARMHAQHRATLCPGVTGSAETLACAKGSAS